MTNTSEIGSPPNQGSALVQVIIILRRRWALLVVIWVATIIGVSVYTFTRTKLYRPQATLEIRPEVPQINTEKGPDPVLLASRVMWENYYRTQEQILKSPVVINSVFASLKELDAEYSSSSDPVRAFASKMDIERVRSSFLMKIGFIDPDPDKATNIVKALVGEYQAYNSERLRRLNTGKMEFLSERTLPAMRKRLESADSALQEFKKDTGYIDFEEQYLSLVEARRKIGARLTDLLLERATNNAKLKALAGYGADGVSGVFNSAFHDTRLLEPLVQKRASLQEDLARQVQIFKNRHPRLLELRAQIRLVEEKIRETIQGKLVALESDLGAVEEEVAALAAEVTKIEDEMGKAGRQLTLFKRLDAELTATKEDYYTFLRKEGETRATSGTGLASVQVIDLPDVPARPFKPNVLINLAIGVALGLVLGIGGIFLSEQLDDRIASADEVEGFLGLSVLGVIPRLTVSAGDSKKPVFLGQESGILELEAFRGLRAEVVTRLEKSGKSPVLAVVSPGAGEGKSTVASNLASVLAMEGRRVLLFDADMRRPSILGIFDEATGPGLEEVIDGGVALEDAVRETFKKGIYVIGAAKGTNGAAELAGTRRFEEALNWSREKYDFVIIDSAPVNQVSESALIARQSDASLLVVREGKTGRGEASIARKRLERLQVPILGAVINCASPRRSSYGYYSYHYYSPRSEG